MFKEHVQDKPPCDGGTAFRGTFGIESRIEVETVARPRPRLGPVGQEARGKTSLSDSGAAFGGGSGLPVASLSKRPAGTFAAHSPRLLARHRSQFLNKE